LAGSTLAVAVAVASHQAVAAMVEDKQEAQTSQLLQTVAVVVVAIA
jgi:hypothetical protein